MVLRLLPMMRDSDASGFGLSWDVMEYLGHEIFLCITDIRRRGSYSTLPEFVAPSLARPVGKH